MQNSVLEPASHGIDLVMAVLPSEFIDTIFRRKDWRRRKERKPKKDDTRSEAGRYVSRTNKYSEGQECESLSYFACKKKECEHSPFRDLLVTASEKIPN